MASFQGDGRPSIVAVEDACEIGRLVLQSDWLHNQQPHRKSVKKSKRLVHWSNPGSMEEWNEAHC